MKAALTGVELRESASHCSDDRFPRGGGQAKKVLCEDHALRPFRGGRRGRKEDGADQAQERGVTGEPACGARGKNGCRTQIWRDDHRS